jgi:hypothetical protein
MLSPISLRAEASFSSSTLARCAAGGGLFEGRNIELEVVPLTRRRPRSPGFRAAPAPSYLRRLASPRQAFKDIKSVVDLRGRQMQQKGADRIRFNRWVNDCDESRSPIDSRGCLTPSSSTRTWCRAESGIKETLRCSIHSASWEPEP